MKREVIHRFLLVMLCMLIATVCIAEPLPCVDTLASAQYGNELKHVPLNYGIRGFAKKEFGDFFPVAKRELEKGRRYVGAALTWRDNHTFTKDDLNFAKKEIKRYQPLCVQYKGRIEINVFTEHNLKQPLLDNWLAEVQREAPDCPILNNPFRGDFSKRFKSEVHNSHSKVPQGEYNFSFDGENSADSDIVSVLNKFKTAHLFCVWHPRLNLRYGPKDTANRAQRVREAKDRSPDKSMLESLVYLFSNKGRFEIPKNWLVKSHAEKHDKNDKKGDKLLIISPIKAAAIELKRAGKLIAKLAYYGSFQGGGFRYYWQKFGYQAGADLDVFIGKKKYGVINAGFRGLTYR